MRRLTNPRELIGRDMYEYYKKRRRKVAPGINQYKLWRKAIAGLIIVMKEMLIENENGVYIEGFGYFYVEYKATARKRISILKKKEQPWFKIGFTFDKEELNEKYKYNVGVLDINPINSKKYEPKLDAIKHEILVKKQFK